MSNIQISNVILWQKNGLRRVLEFKHNSVNVITGDSGKGKSSVLFIIDYCLLASETTGISKTNIDSKVDWYGIKISVNGKELVISRPSESNGATDKAYFNENGSIPDLPILNIKIENLKKILNNAFGIDTELRVPYGGRYIQTHSKVSFRNFLAYSYQDQSTMVAPDHLYIRPADGRYQEAIERTFRMAIGAENVDTAISRNRLDEIEKKKDFLIRKKEIIEKTEHIFYDDVNFLCEKAYSFGIIKEIPESYQEKILMLKGLIENPVNITDHRAQINKIENEIFSLSSKNKKLKSFIENKPSFISELKENEDTLKPITIFNEVSDKLFPSKFASLVIEKLQCELTDIKKSLRNKNNFPFMDEVLESLNKNKEKIKSLQNSLLSLNVSSEDTYTPSIYYRFIGQLETKLDFYKKSTGVTTDLNVDQFNNEIEALKKIVDNNEEKSSIAKQKLNELINKRIRSLPLKGYDDFKASYYEKEKLIHLHSFDLAQYEKMPDVGSASNYLYLHIAHFLAIHEIAKQLKISWIPSFLVLDQVSTPYFSSDGKANDDVRSLDKVLLELNKFTSEMDKYGGFQFILLEHIDKSHWTSLKLNKFHLVDRELRDGYGLIIEKPMAPPPLLS
ncbi:MULTISPECIES: DUF3732 domain-containing protein [unclassified Enterobacter]|jgi:hypothetical protein|uniref:DUF3732 domain-containing protein n=1 Tax=unclassified Enterobacter TaxID=2608935 RepID=UPI0015CDBD4E|nr:MULTISPECIES: DUF3732 domain-containing protein [unclassified Enterobacter]MBB3303931.1 hypothetical protein [Enterobacter sp. Sphag1F]NYI12964.1 hypothetical protein [Enterobacter sp. Sphag71]